MEVDRKELSVIKELLKLHPRGMTVTEISKEVKMNRHSVAKYLEIMAVSGQIDMKSFGPSKVYYISQRLPISAMLSFSSDLIVILDKDLRIVNVNEKFLEFTKMKREEIINKNIETFSFPVEFEPSIDTSMKDARDGIESVIEAVYKKENSETYFIIKFIPMVFDDAEKGVTIIFEDVTGHKQSENTIRENEQKFRSIIEQSSEGIMLTDEHGRIIEFNKSMEIVTGYRREDNVGRYIWEAELFTELIFKKEHDHAVHFKEAIIKFLKTGKTQIPGNIIEKDITGKDGETKTVQIAIFPIKTEKGFKLGGIARDFTERKRMETALKESEEQFRTLAESTTGGIVILQGGKLIYVNHASEVITGYTKEELYSLKMHSLVHPDHREMLNKGYEKIRNNKTPRYENHGEIKIRTKAGNVKWINFNMSTMKLNGKPAIINTFFDLTDRKWIEEELKEAHDELEMRVKERTSDLETANTALRSEMDKRMHMEEALRRSETRYKYLIENIDDIIWETDEKSVFVYVSPRVSDVLGYEPSEIVGKTPYDLMSPLEGKRVWDLLYAYEKSNQVIPIVEMEILNKNGSEAFIESNVRYIKGPDGQILGYNGISRDITLRKAMEKAIRASEEKYRNLVEKIDDWVWEMNEKFVFTYSSPKVADILGYSPDEIIGKSLYDIMDEDERRRVPDIVKPCVERKQPFSVFENTLITKDGHKVTIEVSGAPIFDENGVLKGYRGIDRDVTSKRQAEEKLRWNETFLRTMVDNSPLAIYVSDSINDRILYHNKRFIELWGLSQFEPDIINREMTVAELVKYVLPQVENIADVIGSEKNNSDEPIDEIHLKDGRTIRRISAELIDENDRNLGRLRIFDDITERKRAELALWENQRFLTTLIGNLPGMVYRCRNDDEWTMEYASDGCRELTGYQPLDLVMNKNISYNSIVHPEDRERIHVIINKALDEGKPFKIEYRIITATGDVKWVWEQGCMSQPLENKEQTIEGFITDITDKKAVEERITALASFPEMNPSPVIEINTKEQIVYMNPATRELFPGLAPGHPLIGGLRPIMEEFKSGGLRSYSRELRLDHTTYSQYIYYVPEKNMLRIYAADITKRKQAEAEAQAVNRALRMLNDCNQALVRATDEQALLQNICRIIVEQGGYRLAWVGFKQYDENRSIIPVVQMGYDNGYVKNINASWGDNEYSNGPTGMSVKTGKPVIARYTATDPNFSPWREEALKRGYASTISLPLISGEQTIGTLSIYSTMADAFDPTELKLLEELADYLAYGITSLRMRAEHAKAEETLRLMKFTIDRMNEAAYWIGSDAHIYYVNEAACRELGYSQEEMLQMSVSDIFPTVTIDQWPERWEQIKKAKLTRIQGMLCKKDGALLPVEITSNYIDFNGKQYDFAFTVPIQAELVTQNKN